jgi:hypothetical protein
METAEHRQADEPVRLIGRSSGRGARNEKPGPVIVAHCCDGICEQLDDAERDGDMPGRPGELKPKSAVVQ